MLGPLTMLSLVYHFDIFLIAMALELKRHKEGRNFKCLTGSIKKYQDLLDFC